MSATLKMSLELALYVIRKEPINRTASIPLDAVTIHWITLEIRITMSTVILPSRFL
jgi:hypothetical protein